MTELEPLHPDAAAFSAARIVGDNLRTYWRKVRIVGDPAAWAACSCGWKKLLDNRELARRFARLHRADEPHESAVTVNAR